MAVRQEAVAAAHFKVETLISTTGDRQLGAAEWRILAELVVPADRLSDE